MIKDYDDIINTPYKKSITRPHMSLIDRAAQFSPFAALTTHSNAIKEAGRLTSDRIVLDETSIQILNGRFQILIENIDKHPIVTFTYFIKDKYKSGGKYEKVTGQVKKIDGIEPIIYLENGIKILMMDVINITGEIFS